MSKKAQITILFIIMIIIGIIFKYVYKANDYFDYKYGLVNTTNDENIENTLDKNESEENYLENINEVLDLTNLYRNEVGLNQLSLDENLCEAATVRASEMAVANNLSHTRPDGEKCFVVLDDLGINYVCAAENIADGFTSSETVCDAWKNSEGHYKNIICNKYNKIGIGLAKSTEGKYYWAQIFSN